MPMDKVAEFINTGCYREALARLCRLAQEPIEDGRRVLDDWELAHHPAEIVSFEVLSRDQYITVTAAEIERVPLHWLRALDDHCHHVYGPDNAMPQDIVVDGFGGSKVLPTSPRFGGGARKQQMGNLSYWLKHHRVVPLDNPQGIPVDVAVIPKGYAEWTNRRLGKEILRIGIVHFTDDIRLDMVFPTNSTFFYCQGLDDEETRLHSALEHIRHAKRKQVHMLIMPELTITPNLRSRITDIMMQLSIEQGDDHELSVPIIVLGSFHERVNEKWRNHAEAVVGLDGVKLFGCDKRKSVTFRRKKECLQCSPTPVTCLYSSIGLTGMAICKDLFEGEPAAILQSLSLDWLLVPSMSDNTGPHEAEARRLFNINGTVVVVANQEMPHASARKTGFVHHHRKKAARCDAGLTIIEVALNDRDTDMTDN
ncbi:MAG: hypothetical protein HGB01_03000 [Chlorobiaceae bacterium]|nr:hypothetical protein [Chlorobiaceae bacterium]